jgi:leukotriene-A4 hydrolase
VQTFVGQSIETETWKAHLYTYFKANGGQEKIAILDAVDWDVSHACKSTEPEAQNRSRHGCMEKD